MISNVINRSQSFLLHWKQNVRKMKSFSKWKTPKTWIYTIKHPSFKRVNSLIFAFLVLHTEFVTRLVNVFTQCTFCRMLLSATTSPLLFKSYNQVGPQVLLLIIISKKFLKEKKCIALSNNHIIIFSKVTRIRILLHYLHH